MPNWVSWKCALQTYVALKESRPFSRVNAEVNIDVGGGLDSLVPAATVEIHKGII